MLTHKTCSLPAVFGTTSALSCRQKKTHETTDQNETPDQAHGRAEGCSVGRSSHLEGYPAERLSARGDVEVNRGVLVGRSRAAAAQAGSGEGQ